MLLLFRLTFNIVFIQALDHSVQLVDACLGLFLLVLRFPDAFLDGGAASAGDQFNKLVFVLPCESRDCLYAIKQDLLDYPVLNAMAFATVSDFSVRSADEIILIPGPAART